MSKYYTEEFEKECNDIIRRHGKLWMIKPHVLNGALWWKDAMEEAYYKGKHAQNKNDHAEYCCDLMQELDGKEIIDYCVPNLTTLDVGSDAYPIYFCPFCGKQIEGSQEAVKELKRRVGNLNKEGKKDV